MCGIAGIIAKNKEVVDSEKLKKMTDIVAHRGPDGEGHYIDKNIGLGHRRLAIIDLSEAGHQPMEFDNFIIVFNGEIYNYKEIKNELKDKGHSFITETDTEVIIHAYREWKEKCVDKFNGMWAFAIYDKKDRQIFMSRDRFGIKPFYFYHNEDYFLFGSEIKQILPFLKEKKVNKQVLYDFLYTSYHHHSEDTFFDGIKSLNSGHNLFLDIKTRKFIIKRYYVLKKKQVNKNKKMESFIQDYKKEFENAIKFRLRSDVKVGTCLSGGLDSSYVAKIASENYKNKDSFTAITAKSIDKINDESFYAKKIVDSYNLKWKVTEPEKSDFYKSLDEIIYIQEEPFGSPSIIMQYFVMKKAKEERCKVMLDGQGGDETLLGYERYFVSYLRNIKNPVHKIKHFFALSNNSKLSFFKLFFYYIYFSFDKVRHKRILFKNKFILEKNKGYLNKKLLKEFHESSKNIFHLQKKEICKLQLPKLLKFEDRNSMANSIEARVPFIDHNLVELAISIPTEYKIRDGWSKYILRKCYGSNAPKDIVWRKNKYGFEAPTRKWMNNKDYFIKEVKASTFLDHVIYKDYPFNTLDDNSLWKLYSIAVWARKFNVKY